MSDTPDIGKLIQMIMSNPTLVEEISKLGSSGGKKDESEPLIEATASEPVQVSTSAEPVIAPLSPGRAKRTQLLGALKPYVSTERAKAIDSMISVAEILDMMKAR